MDDYTDILQHPRYVLKHHRTMTIESRAAQFSAFAALTGYDEEIDETARLTDDRAALSEDDLAELNAAFRKLIESEQPCVTLTYFVPDERKTGGAYLTYTGHFRFFDQEEGLLKFTDGTAIIMQNVCHIAFSSPEQ